MRDTCEREGKVPTSTLCPYFSEIATGSSTCGQATATHLCSRLEPYSRSQPLDAAVLPNLW